MNTLLLTLWFIWEVKYILFWLYLWQLKEYHVGRFIDHFNTDKGKKLLLSAEQIIKLCLLFLAFTGPTIFDNVFIAVALIYLVESIFFIRNILNKNAKHPKTTKKMIFLGLMSFVFLAIFSAGIFDLENVLQVKSLLIFDLLTPILISVIVLIFQPVIVLLRNNTLKKAEEKIKAIKLAGKLKVVAITGSYGKTSTKEFLATILSKKFKVLKTKEHQNSEIGIAKAILGDLTLDHEIFISEIGAYNKGKVKEVCKTIIPDIGIVTGVNEQHLALFGSLENLLSAEGGGELTDALGNEGILVVNGDNRHCLNLYKKFNGHKKIYNLSNKTVNSDIWTDSIDVYKDHLSFIAINKSKEMAHFDVSVLGKQNIQNLLGAILIAKELGMTFGEISEACENIKQEFAGMTLKQNKHGIIIVDSSYSSNSDGVYADLDYLSIFSGKRIIVMPCLIELGEKSVEIHEKIGKKIGAICDMAIVTTKDKFAEIKNGALSVGMQEKNIVLCDKPDDIYSLITSFCKTDDAVLLEGRVPKQLIDLLK